MSKAVFVSDQGWCETGNALDVSLFTSPIDQEDLAVQFVNGIIVLPFRYQHAQSSLLSLQGHLDSFPPQTYLEHLENDPTLLVEMDSAMGGLCDQAPRGWPPESPKPPNRKPVSVARQPKYLPSQLDKSPRPALTFPEDDGDDDPTSPPKAIKDIQRYNPHRIFRDDPFDDALEVQLARQREAEWEAQFTDHEDTDWGSKVEAEYRDSIFSEGNEGWRFERGLQVDAEPASDDEKDVEDVNVELVAPLTAMTSGGEVSDILHSATLHIVHGDEFNTEDLGAVSVSSGVAVNNEYVEEEGELDTEDEDEPEPEPRDLKPVPPRSNPEDLLTRLLRKGLHLDVEQKSKQKLEAKALAKEKEEQKMQVADTPMDMETTQVKIKKRAALTPPSPFIIRKKAIPPAVKKANEEKQKKASDARVARMMQERKRDRTLGSGSLAQVASAEMEMLEES